MGKSSLGVRMSVEVRQVASWRAEVLHARGETLVQSLASDACKITP